MAISILQLSDIHLTKTSNSIFNKLDKLYDAIKNEIDNSSHLFIVFTGDIAFSGNCVEYENALSFINRLQVYLNADVINVELIFTPGNHDCDFSEDQEVRNILIDRMIENPATVTPKLISKCTEVQNEYFKFIKQFNSYKNKQTEISNELFLRYEYEIESYKIAFNSYNLSWISKRNESQSEIIYPTDSIDKNMISTENYDLTISLFHHPLHWLEHNNMRLFKELINSTSNIVLTGHEHTHSTKIESKIDSKQHIEYIEAGVLQDSHNEDESSFNLINIDFETKKQDIIEYIWNKALYEKNNIYNAITLPFHNKSIYRFKDAYKIRINTLGLKVSHPTKENMTLEDIFIYQDLHPIGVRKNSKITIEEYNSEKLKTITEIGHTIIYGAETAGKTSLIRVLQLKYKRDGLVPIIIDGKNIKSNNFYSKNIKEIILKAFKSQYEHTKDTLSNFEQLDKEQVVLFFDDFQESTLNSEYKSKFIDNLVELKYTNIMIFSHESLRLEATTECVLAKSLMDFNHYNILELGHKLRDKMIRKWISLGRETSIENQELIFTARGKSKSIDTTIGYNIVPAFPIYILTLLQAMEANDTHMLEKSSYGHYYHFLIMQYLNAGTQMKNNDINTIFKYVSTLAYKCLSIQKYTFSYQELLSFDREYCEQKKFTPTFNIIHKLIESNILSEYDEEYKFSHNYLYYYFVAQYLADNINENEIQKIIEKMCNHLYRIEFANIVIFLIHHSPQKFILEILVNKTKEVFSDISEFEFSSTELQNINSLMNKERLKLENRTLSESRKLELEEKESRHKVSSATSKNDREEADYNEVSKELDTFSKINLAFKMIEILGEIIKNYSGSLDGDIKHALIKETFSVGLRSQKKLISFFEDNHGLLLEEIESMIEKKHIITEDKKSQAAADIVFGLVSSISTNIVKKIAKAVASKDLKQIYRELVNENPDNMAIELINQAILLDFQNGLNQKDIEVIHNKLKNENNRISDSTLKKLVIEHIYMFDVEHSKKHSICKKLDISSENSTNAMLTQLKK